MFAQVVAFPRNFGLPIVNHLERQRERNIDASPGYNRNYSQGETAPHSSNRRRTTKLHENCATVACIT
jgi:hypothetical protein